MKNECLLIKFMPQNKMAAQTEAFLEQNFDVISINFTDDALEEVVCYARTDFDIKIFEDNAQKQKINLPPYRLEKLRQADWLSAQTGGFEPLETKEFCIASALRPKPLTDKILLNVHAATAFGSTHQTTRLCLKALESLKEKNFDPKHILDMGTGSGILAIAAARLWDKESPKIVAVDIDSEAVRVAQKNLKANDVSQNISVVLGNGFKVSEVTKNAPYDLILANILARPLKEMAADVCAALKIRGVAVLSGFVDNQTAWVAQDYQSLGLKVLKEEALDRWRALLLEKTK